MKGLESTLKEKGIYLGKTEGDSMYPMLVEGRDTVIIKPPLFPLKKYDVPVYRRGDHYTMHRIVKVTKKGYVICGDNRTFLEKDITDADIVGLLSGFYQNGTLISCDDEEYLRYARRICRSLPLRRGKNLGKRILRKIKKGLSH